MNGGPRSSRRARSASGEGRRRGLLTDRRGVAAVEFALIMPLLAMAYLGGFAICEACSTYRKLADATVETANVTAQFTTMQVSDAQGVMSDTAQIMAPYATNNLSMIMTVIQTDGTTPYPNVTVLWSQGYQGGVALPKGPTNWQQNYILAQNSTYIMVIATYNYVPMFGTSFIPSIPMSDYIYVLPRQSPSIPCPTC